METWPLIVVLFVLDQDSTLFFVPKDVVVVTYLILINANEPGVYPFFF